MKIIPAIDLMEGKVVRLFKGDPSQKTIYNDNPLEIAKKWQDAGADMIHLVDLDATLGRGSNLEQIQSIVEKIDIPIEVAGGLRDKKTVLDVANYASRVVIGTMAFKDESTLLELANEISKDKIVISVDHVDGSIVINGWQNNIGLDLIESINKFLQHGFSEFLLTNVSRDGTLEGPDLKFLEKACKIDGANIIASGGISNNSDVKDVLSLNAFGVILGKALYENKISIEEAKKLVDSN